MRPTVVSSMRAFARTFRSLRNRNYRLFWFGQLVSLIGTWMQDVALSWLVLSLTDSPEALGIAMAIRFGPALFLPPYAGVLADRLSKRWTMTVCQSTQLAVALALAILTSAGSVTIPIIYVLLALRGILEATEGPTRQAFVSDMVGPEDLPNGVALTSTLVSSARMVGPALGAAVITAFGGGMRGMAVCFYTNAASFAAVIGALLAMRSRELFVQPHPAREGPLRQLREGLRYVRRTPWVLVIVIAAGFLGAFGYNFQTLLPLVAKYVLNGQASTLGLLLSTMAAGSIVAGLVVASQGKPSQRRLLVSGAAYTVLLALVGVSQWLPLTGVLLFASGFMAVVFMTGANTLLQLGVPGNMRGRVMGIYVLLLFGTMPIGSYLIGSLAERLSVEWTAVAMAGLCAVGVIWASAYARRSSRRLSCAQASTLLEADK